jgi:hypothetical protein
VGDLRLAYTSLLTNTGGLHGSSYLNEAFRDHLLRRLKDEDYLQEGGETIAAIVDTLTVAFENNTKRFKDITKPRRPNEVPEGIIIKHLRADRNKRFAEHSLKMSR